MIIRQATAQDWPLIYPIYAAIMAEGKTYAFPDGQDFSQVARFFAGMDLVAPRLAPAEEWRPEPDIVHEGRSAIYGAVGSKP